MLRLLTPTLHVLTALHDMRQMPWLQVPNPKLHQTHTDFEFQIFAEKLWGSQKIRLRSMPIYPMHCSKAWWHQMWKDAESKKTIPSPAVKAGFHMRRMSPRSLTFSISVQRSLTRHQYTQIGYVKWILASSTYAYVHINICTCIHRHVCIYIYI